MKTGIIKLLISLFSLTILLIFILISLFLEDFLTSRVNDFLGKAFTTESSLKDLNIKLISQAWLVEINLSISIEEHYIKRGQKEAKIGAFHGWAVHM